MTLSSSKGYRPFRRVTPEFRKHMQQVLHKYDLEKKASVARNSKMVIVIRDRWPGKRKNGFGQVPHQLWIESITESDQAFSGSLIPPVVIIYVASRSGQSILTISTSQKIWIQSPSTNQENQQSWQLAPHHDLYEAAIWLWTRGQGYGLQQACDHQLLRIEH